MTTSFIQLDPAAPLQPHAPPQDPRPPHGTAETLRVRAAAPGARDLRPPPATRWPRVPGGVFIAQDAADQAYLCGGFLPCGECPPCQGGTPLSCAAPTLPGVNAPGGFGEEVALDARRLAPLPGLTPAEQAAVAAVTAAAGPTYQAAALAGMIPGDAVLLLGDAGPGGWPARVLQAMGLAVTAGGSLDHDAAGRLPGGRCHVIDLCAPAPRVALWAPLLPRCLTCTLVAPAIAAGDAAVPLAELLAGQCAVRGVRDIHPHLLLDLAALVVKLELHRQAGLLPCGPADLPQAYAAFCRGTLEGWPVLLR